MSRQEITHRPSHRRRHSDGSTALFQTTTDSTSGESEPGSSPNEQSRKRHVSPNTFLNIPSVQDAEKSLRSPEDASLSNPNLSVDRRPCIRTAHRRSASHSGLLLTSAHGLGEVAISAVEHAEELVIHLWKKGWKVVHHHSLPHWLKDNDYLLRGHRPQLRSFKECFRSIFRLHTETGNIWTHLIGFIFFLVLSIIYFVRPGLHFHWHELVAIQVFFWSAIIALGFSWMFHTFYCHSERVGRFFNKLDYAGISLLVVGSSVPWLHYSFYCHLPFKVLYITTLFIIGLVCVLVCTQDYFLTPNYRACRAVLFICFGLSATIPCTHYLLMESSWEADNFAALGLLVLMAVLYITGAVIYAVRFPERLFPGRFDIWFQSHQIFHVFVVLAALVHLNGILLIAKYRHSKGDCN